MRHARRDGLDLIDAAQKDGEVSEDESRGAHEKVQELTDGFVKRVDEIIKNKEAEIMDGLFRVNVNDDRPVSDN